MNMRVLTFAVCVLSSCALLSAQQQDPILENYVKLALTTNPVITVAEAQRDATQKKIARVGALPDPMIGFGIDEYPLSDVEGVTDADWERAGKVLSLRQQFPWPGTLGSEKAMVRGEFDMKTAMAERERAMLTFDVKKMYYEWAKIREQRALLDSALSEMKNMAELTQQAYGAGMGKLTDVLQAQAEQLQMQTMRSELNAMEQAAVAELNICCQLPPQVMTTPPQAIYQLDAPDLSYDTLLALCSDGPEMREADAKWHMAASGIRNARKMRYPMFELSAEMMRRTEDEEDMEMASGMVGMTLPIWARAKQNKLIAERTIEREQTEAERDVTFNNIRLKLTSLLSKARSLSEQLELYRLSIIPTAARHYNAAGAEYRVGKADFMFLIKSWIALLESRRTQVELMADFNTTWAELESLTGKRLF